MGKSAKVMKTPRPFQLQAINRMKDQNTYLTDDCGLGKTLTAIESVKAYGGTRNLVVCPKNVRYQWAESIQEQDPSADIIITDHFRYDFNNVNAWFISSYHEMVPRSILYPAAQTVWHTITYDEAHRMRNHSTQRSKNLIMLRAARKFALSATPIETDGGQLWPVLKWLAPEKFPAYWPWVYKTFEVKKGYFGGYEIGDPKDIDKYAREIRPYIIKRTKKEVAPDLPERIDIRVPLLMGEEQSKVYDAIDQAKDVLVKIQDVEMLITNALTLFVKLHQVASLPSALGIDAPSVKMEWLKEFVEDHPNLRLLVFSRYREVVSAVHRELNDYGVYTVMSGINESQRFKQGDGRILAGTIDSMSEALDLGMADAAVLFDQHWSATRMQQVVDRIHRMSITSTKFIYYLQAAPVDLRVIKAVDTKQSEAEMLLSFVQGHKD